MTLLLIITGPPASGKTTIGRRLARDLGLPFVNKDDIKERLFDTLGWKDRPWSRKLGIASYSLLYYFAETQLTVGRSLVVESNFGREKDTPRVRAMQQHAPFRVVQVLCCADGPVLVQRFVERDDLGKRHQGHVDKVAIEDVRAVLETGRIDPLDIEGPVIDVDTTDWRAVDHGRILQRVRDAIGPD